ncbi:MAG: hypothetical protein KGN34_00890 [Sphingomonadales bacterium]|nr:hypothetical protein [Sphingomonadales bacterium]
MDAELRKAFHDLRQPLNVIRLACGNLRERVADGIGEGDSDYLRTKIERIDEQTTRASALLEQLAAQLAGRTGDPACTE